MSAPQPARPQGIERVVTLMRLFRREKEDPAPFYRMLAAEAVEDLESRHGPFAGKTIADLGCGPGFYTEAFRARGARTLPVDRDAGELALAGAPPEDAIVADAGNLPLPDASVDGVFCSNLLEHTEAVEPILAEMERVLRPGGWGYISWTNWYSPWGGHDMSPYHYLGPRLGPRLYERIHGPPRKNPYGAGLWAVHVGPTIRAVRARAGLEIERVEPRYWPKLALICRIPLLRELITWNCVIRVRRRAP